MMQQSNISSMSLLPFQDKKIDSQLNMIQEQPDDQAEAKRMEKKKKLNQRKKRQRQEKKKRLQTENELIMQQQLFDQDIDDEQLLQLLFQYDCKMSQSDQEYLLQIDNREALVQTIYAKLLEREQLQVQQFEDDYGDEDQLPYFECEESLEAPVDRCQLGLVHKNLKM